MKKKTKYKNGFGVQRRRLACLTESYQISQEKLKTPFSSKPYQCWESEEERTAPCWVKVPLKMNSSRVLSNLLHKKNSNFLLSSIFFTRGCHPDGYHASLQCRSIFSTTQLQNSWMDKIKGVFTGKSTSQEETQISSESFTLLRRSHVTELSPKVFLSFSFPNPHFFILDQLFLYFINPLHSYGSKS